MSFDFGSTSTSLTAKDIAEILGLPQEGEEVELKGSRGYKSDFMERYFDVILVSKKMVDAALEEALKGKRKTDAKDVIRLILIELCITFLLCNSNHMATGIVIQYCEDLENISRYSWAKVVVDILHRALKTKASQLKSCSVPGCVVVIMVIDILFRILIFLMLKSVYVHDLIIFLFIITALVEHGKKCST